MSKIFGGITDGGEGGGRVRGIFYPQSAESQKDGEVTEGSGVQ